MIKKYFLLLAGLVLIAAGLGFSIANASATEDDSCVPMAAWTENIDHPEVSHEETTTVIDDEAWTEVIPATADLWWNWSPNDTHGPQDYVPAFPSDDRGTWQGPHEDGGPMQDTYGTFQTGGGNSPWFHREQGQAEQTIEHDAVTHDETVKVVDHEAWSETIEHPAVVCEGGETPVDECLDPVTGEDLCIHEEPEMNTPVVDVPVVTNTPEDDVVTPAPAEKPQKVRPKSTSKCLGGALVTKTTHANGNITTSIVNGNEACLKTVEPGGVKEEGM